MTDSDAIGAARTETETRAEKPAATRAKAGGDPLSLRELLAGNRKFYAFLGLIFLLLRSDVFQNSALSRIKGATDIQGATTWGELITLVVFLFLVIMLQILLKNELI